MRNFFLFVLLINLLAFAYQSWILEPAKSVAPDFAVQDVPELLQVERKQDNPPAVMAPALVPAGPGVIPPETAQQAAEIPVVQPQLPDAAAVYQCLRIGPFAREEDVESVQTKLQRQGATVQRTAEAGRVWLGYWVQTAAYSSKQAAENARKKLIAKDMPDVYVMSESNEYRVSLGVFRLRTSAAEVVDRAQRLGFSTRTVERFQPGKNFWLLVQNTPDPALLKNAIPNVPGQILRSERVACPASGI
jgi:cell division protein FtsN